MNHIKAVLREIDKKIANLNSAKKVMLSLAGEKPTVHRKQTRRKVKVK